MEFQLPTEHEAFHGLRAMRSVAVADGELQSDEVRMLAAVQRVFGVDFPVADLTPIRPEELAEEVQDARIRRQLVNGLVVMSMIDKQAAPEELRLIREFAAALEVSDDSLRNLQQLAEGRLLVLRLDLLRRYWAIQHFRRAWNEEGLKGLLTVLRKELKQLRSKKVTDRYRALEACPPGSLGHSYYEFCTGNGFALPGERGSFPEVIVVHDMIHVLSEYGTDPTSEIDVECFSAGCRREDPFTFIFFILLQFHLGIQTTPITKATSGFLDSERAIHALQRGLAVNTDFTDGWDYWEVIEQPLGELRQRYNIPPRGIAS